MTVDGDEAVAVMRRLARPAARDLIIVAGESGGVGLAGLMQAVGNREFRAVLKLTADARALVINTEGATDPGRYAALTGSTAKANSR